MNTDIQASVTRIVELDDKIIKMSSSLAVKKSLLDVHSKIQQLVERNMSSTRSSLEYTEAMCDVVEILKEVEAEHS